MQGKINISNGIIEELSRVGWSLTINADGNEHVFEDGFAFPGFVDSHGHVAMLGEHILGLALDKAESKEECVQKAIDFKNHKNGWIYGRGWNDELWQDKSLPDKTLLDRAFPDKPALLVRIDGHAAWANSKALELAGIKSDTPNPQGGEIRKLEDGSPSGILIDYAINLVSVKIPDYTDEQYREFISIALDELASTGLSEVHDMDMPPRLASIFIDMDKEGKLPIRIQAYISAQKDEWLENNIQIFKGEMFNIIGLKFYADGALGSRGAALFEPYFDKKDEKGLFLIEENVLYKKAKKGIEAGFDIAVHAIGDAAVNRVINVYEKLINDHIPREDTILRIEHFQNLKPEDIERTAKLGIKVTVQPMHCISDAKMARARLGGRCKNAYIWRSLVKAGIEISGGSDFPIESHAPLDGIDGFVRRIPVNEHISWFPEERLGRTEALEAYTINAHKLIKAAHLRGVLEKGRQADIVVLNNDIRRCRDEDIKNIKILAVFCNGKKVY